MSKENGSLRTTRYGNDFIADVRHSYFHKPKKEQYTTILEFEVVKPQHDLETVGERLKLSMFGEYCPDASLRGYELEELLMKPQHYRPKVIVQMGETVSLNFA
tara:strand:+ start:160 stop:468 length:309 start_codon:yes stop_codon:yes gene_type:complete